MQDSVSQSGTLQLLVHKLGCSNVEVRTSAVWALANMAYMASPAVSKALLQALSWTQVCGLLQAGSSELQVGTACMHLSHALLTSCNA